MNSQSYPALIRSMHLFVRGFVIALVLITSLVTQSGSNSPQDAVQAAEESPSITLSQAAAEYASFPLSFVPNAGQVDSEVHFEVRGMGGNLYFTAHEVMLYLPVSAERDFSTVRLNFIGSNTDPAVTTTDLLPGIVNYLFGSDPAQWITNVPTYGGITYEELYPGISLHYDGTQGLLKGTYQIAPHVDPGLIRWQYAGITQAQLDPATQALQLYLTASTEADAPYLAELAPVAWQEINGERVPVQTHYRLLGNDTFGFALDDYDPAYALTIDPVMQYKSYFGGASIDEGFGITADTTANAYITGRTDSLNLPTLSPYQGTNAGSGDAFVSKISMPTKTLIYSTYLGGNAFDVGYSIAIDASGNAYVTGETQSTTSFPTVAGSYQTTNAGGTDAFVVKLNASGSALVYSSFLGGTSVDRGNGIAVNASGNAFVAGATVSNDFPIFNALPGYNTYGGGSFDAFVTRFTVDGTDVQLSTYLGGTDADAANDIVVNGDHVFITGRTDSTIGFPVVSAFQSTNAGAGDAFVTRFVTGGSPTILYSTFLGGNGLDIGQAITLDSSNKAVVAGETDSTDFPRQGALPDGLGGTDKGGIDAFVAAYTGAGAKVYSTYLGGANNDKAYGIGLDSSNNMYVAGETQSSDFPNVSGFQAGFGGLSDAFVTKILAVGTSLEYSSFVGGSNVEQAFDLAVSSGGSAYVTGDTWSDDFNPTPGTFQRGGGVDAFMLRIGANSADLTITKLDDISSVAVGADLPYTITVTNLGPDTTTATVTDTLVSYLSFVSATPSKGSCSYDSGTRKVTCVLGDMIAAESATINLVVNVLSRPTGGNAFNSATVVGTEFDPDLLSPNHQNTYSQITTVFQEADLEVTKTANKYRVRAGETLYFYVAIHNLGPGIATGVQLTDILPSEVSFVSATPPGTSTYDSGTGLWNVGSIPVGTTVTLTIQTTVDDPLPVGTLFSNTANNLIHPESDPDSANNQSTIELRVVTDYPEPGCHPSPTNPNEVICLSG